VDGASSRGLAIWSALGGAAAIPALFLLFRRLEGRDHLAWWATLTVAASPLFWFAALRPLSDMLGFAAAVWVMALLAGRPSSRQLIGGALLAGLAIGIRSQTLVLTLPAVVFALGRRGEARTAIGAVTAMAAGSIAWAVPLLVASGGLSSYLAALGSQAGEDFSGVAMLWTHHGARDIAHALANTFIWPWDWRLGLAVCALAAAGAVRLAWRAPLAAAQLAILFAPYAVFHLLFQETETTRYALPLLPVLAYAAMAAVEGLPARALPAAAIGIAAIGLVQALPASLHYAREGAPVFRALDDMAATAHGGDRVDRIGMHASVRRAAQWATPILPARLAAGRHGQEWLALVALWQAEPSARVWFVADPARTDLALFDPHARDLARAYRWGFVEPPFVGGARPDNVDWYRMQAPGWMLDRGWSVTAEVGGVTAREGLGSMKAPTAWLRGRAEPLTVVVGGRYLPAPGAAPATVTVRTGAWSEPPFTVQPGFFVRVITIPAGTLAGGPSYSPLEVVSSAPVSLEQFDAEPPGVPMLAFRAGWMEPEYSADTGRAWRWSSEKSELWIRPVGRDVTLRLTGESPLRYFDGPARVRVLVGEREVASFDLSADFDRVVTVPADLLAAAAGTVRLESSRFFVPGSAGAGDQRHLALRLYSVSVE
jgi:hypothetical protein